MHRLTLRVMSCIHVIHMSYNLHDENVNGGYLHGHTGSLSVSSCAVSSCPFKALYLYKGEGQSVRI